MQYIQHGGIWGSLLPEVIATIHQHGKPMVITNAEPPWSLGLWWKTKLCDGRHQVSKSSRAVIIGEENKDQTDQPQFQWNFKQPKIEVLYHIFCHILWGYSLKLSPYIGLTYGRYLRFRFLKWPLTIQSISPLNKVVGKLAHYEK